MAASTYTIEQRAEEAAETRIELRNLQLALIRLSQDVRYILLILVPIAVAALTIAVVTLLLVLSRPMSAAFTDSPSPIGYRLSAMTRPSSAGPAAPRIALVRGVASTDSGRPR